MTEKSRDLAVDSFRAIAVVSVVLFHYTDRVPFDALRYDQPILPGFWAWGWIGPYWFFIISGFFMASSVSRTRDGVAFLAKRISRIYPAYFVAVILIITYACFVPSVSFPEWNYSSALPPWPDVLANFFFATDLGFDYVDGAFWTLVVELKFYTFLAIAHFGLFRRKITVTVARLFWVALMLGSIWVLVNQVLLSGGGSDWLELANSVLQTVTIALDLPFFMLGMVFARWLGDRSPVDALRSLVLLALCCAVLATLSYGKPYSYENTLVTLVVFLGVTLLIVGLLFAERSVLGGPTVRAALRPLAHIGAISYSWYLVHQNIGISAIYHLNAVLPGWVTFVLVTCLTLAAGEVLNRAVEWRFRKPVENAFDRMGRRIMLVLPPAKRGVEHACATSPVEKDSR